MQRNATARATAVNRPSIDTGYRHTANAQTIRRTPKIVVIHDSSAIRQLAALVESRPFMRADLHSTYVKVWRSTRTLAFASTVPVKRDHASDIVIGGKITTPQALADWCNALAAGLGINRVNPKGPYYVPPALPRDFGA